MLRIETVRRKRMKAIRTEGLTKFYGKSRGIVGVDLSVEEGDLFGFIGPNGAGKSTTIRLLLGLISATEGRTEVLGKDIAKHKVDILSEVGYLPSEASFYNGMRVRDIIAFSASLRKKDCSEEAKALCERLELDVNKKVEELSLGNRKKVGIVCAMQHRPRLYIFDEATSGLDPLMQREFYSLIKERNAEGATIFLSSHNLDEVQKLCRSAAVIREGRILISDSVEKLAYTGVKRVTLKGAEQLPRLDGVKDIKTDGGAVSFLYGGDKRELIARLSEIPFEDITLTDPDLEEVFMHYYEREGN
jgi:ABC-2 type transport system ATP-binding protein